MNKIGARFLQGFLVVRQSLLLYMSVDKDKLGSFREGERSDLRPASVTASPVCMTRPHAGVITPVPSTVRSGISMAQTDRRRTS